MKLGFAVLALILLVLQASRARELADSGDLAGAEAEFRELVADDADDLGLRYNLGTVLLGEGKFEESRAHLEKAAAAEGPLGAAAAYNLGNADLLPAFADTALAERDTRLRRAIEAFKDALRADPTDADAKWNLELARRLLERPSRPPAGGGGGGGGEPSNAEAPAAPRTGGSDERSEAMTTTQAEALLRSAQQRELEVQREGLRKPQPAGPLQP